jgi:signal recognition particle receptor subunit beta
MDILRLVVTGTPGVGKTSFVRAISDVEVINTDRPATDETAQLKPTTTVGFDYGRITIGDAIQLHFYGTPGQSRFNFMWDILIRRANAYILLVAAHRPQDLPQAKQIIEFMNSKVQLPMMIGVTYLDCPEAYTPEEILLRLGYTKQQQPLTIAVDVHNPASVSMALNISLLSLLLAQRLPNHGPKTYPTYRTVVDPVSYISHATTILSAQHHR